MIGLAGCIGVEQPTVEPGSTQRTTTTAIESTSSSLESPTTSVPVATTTTTEDPHPAGTSPTSTACRPDPFREPFSRLVSLEYPGRQITAHVYDTRTGCSYEFNPTNRQPTASVFKVMVMAGTLLEAQNAQREVSSWEMSQLTPMITRSTNPQVRRLWSSFGASPWFRRQAEIFNLTETSITADAGSAWGRTRTSASDQVDLIRQVLLGDGGPLHEEYRSLGRDLMTSIDPDQTWGITAGVPASWIVAQKNGFAGATTNSVGWVDEPGTSNGYVVAILTTGWPNFRAGIPAVEYVSLAVAAALVDTVANAR